MNGGERVRVTEDADVDWNPIWSPDGKYLYFSSDRGGAMNLWRIPIDEASGAVSEEPEAITTGASASRQHPSFSRDGRRIAYVEEVRKRRIQKVAFNPTEGTTSDSPLSITRGSRSESNPSISPDGEWLAFREETEMQGDIFIMRRDGTDRRQLTNDPFEDRYPRWSPEGEKIGFYSNRSGTNEIWTINPDGSGLQQLTETPDESVNFAVWSPDGSRMAYYNRSRGRSFVFDLNKSWQEQTPEALPPCLEGSVAFETWSWSQDGKWLAGHAIADDGTNAGIFIYNLTSKQYRNLINYGFYPVWLADSRRLLFYDNDKLLLLDSELGDVREVLTLSPEVIGSGYSISSDNRWIYFHRSTTEADIWMLTLNEEQK